MQVYPSVKKLTFLAVSLISFCTGCAVNPVTGQKELMFISPRQERGIGEQYAPEVTKELDGEIENQQIQDYINRVGQKVANAAPSAHQYNFSFTAVRDESVNAVALPGGYIFITKGMLKKLDSEAQLAAILAHEITHVVARHSSAAMSRQIGISLLLSAVTSEKTPQTVRTITRLTRQLIGLSYSRRDEKIADLGGLDYMTRAGYDPHGMIRIMEILQSGDQSHPPQFLSTHPSPQNRLDYITYKVNSKYGNLKDLTIGTEQYRKMVLNNLPDESPAGQED